jgi:3-oxoisoapionate decarboxylase
MKRMNRREVLGVLAGLGAALEPGVSARAAAEIAGRRTAMGIVTYAFALHQRNGWAGRHPGLAPSLALLEESHELGAGGIQTELGPADAPHVTELHRRAERYGMFVEASLTPPRDESDVARFQKDVELAKEAGATLARTVILPGRRYEQFKSLEEFRRFEKLGLESLQRAAPVLARHRFHLAVENHKDQRIDEKLATLRQVGSEYIGICVDVGNNFPLMEDPLEAVRAYAPLAFTVHLKDQAVRAYDEGFLFADVALGDGFLDLPAMVRTLRAARPGIRFNFETITRDALRVPALTDAYWATLPDARASDLARTLRVVRTQGHREPFPVVSEMPVDRQLALERRNLEVSITYSAKRLGL